MTTGQGTRRTSREDIASLGDDHVRELGRYHLGQLAERQRIPPAELPLTRAPRLRRFGRRIWDVGSKLLDLLEIVGRFLINPAHVPGRWVARLRLFAPTKTFNLWLLGMTAFALLLGLATFLPIRDLPEFLRTEPNWRKGAIIAVMGSLFTGTVLGLLGLLWNDLVRCPHIMRRICRQIRKRPDCVVLNDIGPRAVKLTIREEPVKIVPRTELYDEITPGVLQRKRKDVQIVVGDPGAGKTTAMIGVAEALAKLGIVPVLIPLRSTGEVDLVDLGKQRLKAQIQEYVRSDAQFEQLWTWLYQRRRVALLTDDLDRLSPDGERGFMLRKALKEVETVDLPIIVTARPAGVPAGIAASAIGLGGLEEEQAIECVAKGARNDPSFRAAREVSHQSIARWVSAGKLTEVPYYLELVAQLAAAGKDIFPELAEPLTSTIAIDQRGLFKLEPDRTATWNPWWVHFLLIDHFYREVCAGNVARWKGIQPRERVSTMQALQQSALGMLLAQAIDAEAKTLPHAERESHMPERSNLEQFLPTTDRDTLHHESGDGSNDQPGEEIEDGAAHRRPAVSAHEVIDTAERLRILDRDAEGQPQFRHRITQAYLAGRLLAEIEAKRSPAVEDGGQDWLGLLLDRHHPERLTAHTTLTFAALWADRKYRNAKVRGDGRHTAGRPSADAWRRVSQRILRRLVDGAAESLQLPGTEIDARCESEMTVLAVRTEEAGLSASLSMAGPRSSERRQAAKLDPDPRHTRDPEDRRDPDDALIKLTTAADIAQAIARDAGEPNGHRERDGKCEELPKPYRRHAEGDHIGQCDILSLVRASEFATRWTKLNAIKAIASLEESDRWRRIWQFARDPDYAVRQAAGLAIEQDACDAYCALETDIEELIMRAAALSALDQSLEMWTADTETEKAPPRRQRYYIGEWWRDDVLGLRALATVLPAIVSGLQEDPAAARALAAWQGRDGRDPDEEEWAAPIDEDLPPGLRVFYARRAREALDHLVALAFQGGHHVLERMVAQGFRGDAMRHATGDVESGQTADRSHAGPGWVAAHKRLVVTIGLCQAEHWYAQLVLGQALALYTIAGASRDVGYNVLARCLHQGGPHGHPFTRQALRLARSGVRRHSVNSTRWRAFIWDDETSGSNKRPASLTNRTAQLLGDVTVLLDLSEGAQEDRLEVSGHMDELPYCLHRSRDRNEILSTGCPAECGWNLCPYKQPPPDEPNEHHGVSRAFCRKQRWIARHHTPPWQRRIAGWRLAAFWQEMERRARM